MTNTVPTQNEMFSKEIKEYFKGLDLTFTMFPENQQKSYKSLSHFYTFIQGEIEFWNIGQTGRISSIRGHFNSIKAQLDQLVNINFQTQEQSVKNIFVQVSNLIKLNKFPCVFSSTTLGKFIKNMYEENPMYAEAACDYFFNLAGNRNFQTSLNNKDIFVGLLHSFFQEYPNTAKSIFKSEKESLQHLHTEYTESLNTLDSEYYEKMEDIKSNTTKYQIDIGSWRDELQESTNNFVSEKQKELNDLTKLYEEKLKLEAPAKYWEDTSKEYEKVGKKWMIWAIIVSTVFVIFLTLLLFFIPSDNIIDFNFNSIKMTIILTVIISVGVFLINFFIRLSTSAYHLSRDAKERNKLTYVYLSLLQDKGVEETDRSIILQSLFSRADTGLLKGESGPTLPDGVLGQALKNWNAK